MTRDFVAAIERFAREGSLDLVRFREGERKDDRTQQYLQQWPGGEGVLYIGKAQEKARVLRTQASTDPAPGLCSTRLVSSTAMPNAFYFYAVDEDFGPLFVKFCSYFPYNAKLCLSGHEYLKRQLQREGIGFEALNDGLLSCADPQRLQAICRQLTAARIDELARKWLARLPHPFTAQDRRAGMLYQVSVLQAEFSLRQVFDRPLQGRVFFEEVIRENLDLGRPDQVQLVFGRRVTRRTPSRFRTRVITAGVDPSLHFDHKHSRSKQHLKEGRALRTETTINDTCDFGVGRLLGNLEDLKTIGFQANRRLLRVERLSHDATLGATCFEQLHRPCQSAGQRAPALRFGDPRVQALLAALVVFRLLPRGFDNRRLGALVAPLLGRKPADWKPGRTTYDLRRLRLIERIPRTRRYRVTQRGLRTALCFHRTYARPSRCSSRGTPRTPCPSKRPLHESTARSINSG